MPRLFESLTDDLTISHYDDWLLFDQRLAELVRCGQAKRVLSSRVIHLQDEEWYLDPISGDVYVYVRPDDKILPKWERVDVFAQPEEQGRYQTGLGAIPTGRIDRASATSLKTILNVLLRHGKVEMVSPAPPSTVAGLPGFAETWYSDSKPGPFTDWSKNKTEPIIAGSRSP